MRLLFALAIAAAQPGSAPVLAVGACTETQVTRVEPRLQGAPGSGLFIAYADGLSQVSYGAPAGMKDSRPGDPVKLCLQSRPKNCPPGDSRGAVYAAVDRRTGEAWTVADSSHLCGGA